MNHRDEVNKHLFEAFGRQYTPEPTPLIDDMLAWQENMDGNCIHDKPITKEGKYAI